MIGDTDLAVAKLYNMLPADEAGTSEGRTAATNATVRSVFIIGPDKKIKLMLTYPMTTGRNFDEVLRVLDSMQLTAKYKVATPVNWKQGDDVIITAAVSNEEAEQAIPRLQDHQALPAHHAAAGLNSATMATPRITILGAGFAGLELSTLLSEALGDQVQVTLIDQSDAFVFGFSKLDVMFGRTTLDAVRLPYRHFAKPGVRLLRESVRAIDPAQPARHHRCRHARLRLPRRRARCRLRLRGDAGPGRRQRVLHGGRARTACATCCPASRTGTPSSASAARRTSARRHRASAR